MSRELMIKQLKEWNPHWKDLTIKKWNKYQLIAIYNKELDKHQRLQKINHKQLSFF